MPKSRGHRKGAKNRPVRRSPRPLQPADLLLRDAREIIELDDVLTVETWASSGLGQAWSTAALTEREPEHQLCLRVTGRACTAASPDGLGALAALARVAPAADSSMLTETVAILGRDPTGAGLAHRRRLDPDGGVAGGRCLGQRTGPVRPLRRSPAAETGDTRRFAGEGAPRYRAERTRFCIAMSYPFGRSDVEAAVMVYSSRSRCARRGRRTFEVTADG